MPGASLWLRPPIPGEFGVATCLGGPRIGAADVGRGAQRRSVGGLVRLGYPKTGGS